MQNHKELITAGELSVELRLPLQTIYALTRQDAIPHYRFGRSVRYDLSEVYARATETTTSGTTRTATAASRPVTSRPVSRLREAQRRGNEVRRARQAMAGTR